MNNIVIKPYILYIIANTQVVKRLLIEKGFNINNDKFNLIEKYVLLNTEIAELVDAIKKGKGTLAEAEELADIIIRMLNYPVILPEIIKALEDVLNNTKKIPVLFIQHNTVIKNENLITLDNNELIVYMLQNTYIDLNTSAKNIKMQICEQLFKYSYSLHLNIQFYIEEKDAHLKEKLLKSIYVYLIFILYLCEIYLQLYIPETSLQEIVDIKMNKNFQRPYRYNTSSEFFQ